MPTGRRSSRSERLAARRALLVATATLQRERLVGSARGPLLRISIGWRLARVLARLLAPRQAARWGALASLLALAREWLRAKRD